AALALGTRMRAHRSLSPASVGEMAMDDGLRSALYRQDELDRVVGASRPPSDWHSWMDAVAAVDADIHGGTAGVIDSAFFDRVGRFASTQAAPAEARAGVLFLEGMESWNWPLTAASYRTIIASPDSIPWLPDTLLRNGAAVAYVMMRDTAGAAGVLRTFARRTQEDVFRERLIRSFL